MASAAPLKLLADKLGYQTQTVPDQGLKGWVVSSIRFRRLLCFIR
jgi:hypothetical protein